MTMTSDEAQEIIRLLQPVSRYCELKLSDIETKTNDAEEDLNAFKAEETRFKALDYEQKTAVFNSIIQKLVVALPEYESITLEGVADGEVDEVQDYLDEQGYSNIFDYDAPEIQQFINAVNKALNERSEA
jgi:hypothetical protein